MAVKLSIISPVYNAEKIVDELVRRVIHEAEKITSDIEIVLVEDASSDKSWDKIKENCGKDSRIKGVRFSRNFGQHAAITAGIELCSGEYAIVMDCDLQDDPVYFKELYEKAEKGFNIVYTCKKKRKHSWFKNFAASIFNSLFNYLVDNKEYNYQKNVGSYSLISRNVIDAYKKFGDYRRHYLMVLRWLGFNYEIVVIEHKDRFEGRSSYNFKKLITHAIDGITSQSDKLLRIMAGFGFILSSLAFIAALSVVIIYSIKPFQAGWASIFVLILFVAGLIILSIGITGIYIGKIFEQTKNRPKFIIQEHLNNESSSTR
jgi:glycosyltransferase involved in cell wall biosynthesis